MEKLQRPSIRLGEKVMASLIRLLHESIGYNNSLELANPQFWSFVDTSSCNHKRDNVFKQAQFPASRPISQTQFCLALSVATLTSRFEHVQNRWI